jgi:hypothetical protein
MEHVRRLAEPPLRNPAVLFAFTGWNDAGDAASASVRALIERWDATAIAEIDPEPFTDFATIRPHVRITEGRRSIVWPTVGVWSAAVPGGDVMLVLGPEPSLRWKLFCAQIVGLAEQYQARLAVSLGALLADVPHSRPVQIIGTASDPELVDRYDLHRSRYEGPTGIVGVLHDAMSTAGIPTASLWAAVPQYAAQIPSPKAALALVDRACRLIGSPAPVDVFAHGAAEYDARVAALIADDEDLVEYVSRLESLADDEDDDDEDTGEIEAAEPIAEHEVNPDELVAEVEQFLRDRDAPD